MSRNALAYMGSCLVIVGGLLAATSAQAQSDYSPAKNNCDTKTGCANYATGDTTKANPAMAAPSNAAGGPYDSGPSPAKSNCDNPQTGCANYATGSQSPTNPAKQPQQQK
jgi:hypothetical protein